jgi:SAM-dependent methyltransferase
MTSAFSSLQILHFNHRRALGLCASRRRRGFALRRLIGGLNVVQALEFRLALSHLGLTGAERVLDVASPKLLAAYLAATGKVSEIHLTDLSDPRLEDFRALVPEALRARVVARQLDAVALDRSCGPASFDRVYSLTSLQHFAGDSDILAVQQFARVLKSGGRLFLTVPYGPAWTEEPYPELGGSRKRYDERALAERLRAPGLSLLAKVYYGERWFPIDTLVSRLPKPSLQGLINWMTPVAQPLFWVPCAPARARGVALVFERRCVARRFEGAAPPR